MVAAAPPHLPTSLLRIPLSNITLRHLSSLSPLSPSASEAGGGSTPYRTVLSVVRHRLASTKKQMEDQLSGAAARG